MTESASPELGVGATRVEALYYRSLRYVSQPLGRFHVLVGANASGKSNFLDVLAFLGDVLSTDLQTAMLGDDRLNIPLRATDGRDLLWAGPRGYSWQAHNSFELAVEMAIPEGLSSHSVCRYEVEIDVSSEPVFVAETLWLKPGGRTLPLQEGRRNSFPNPPDPPLRIARGPGEHGPEGWERVLSRGRTPERVNYRSETSGWNAPFQIAAGKSALANLPEDYSLFPVALWFRQKLLGAERIVLSGEAMRRPCPPIRRDDFEPNGSNLPHVVDRLARSHPDRHQRWVRHVREALPEVSGVSTCEREEDRYRYLVLAQSNGQEIPSWLVSDGTLRLLALTLLAYLPDISGMYLIEEPENGLHPLAIETVLQSLSSVYGAQVLVATHSPVVARLIRPEQMICVARDDTAGTDMVQGRDHPRLRSWQGSADMGTLLAGGVLGSGGVLGPGTLSESYGERA